ncbi:hypothetical protein [Bradyrhizobium septentrionale]|jgi:stalled ribosome rescue protein Dom34|uniref:Translational machinery protein n=1 Tax=Bradyrhizobium septentrionale TaxID=1404411 RepID=A0ABZ2P3K5_9BRAD
MTAHNHAVVWIDHRVAKVFYLGLETSDERTIRADLATEHLHHKANTIGSGKALEDPTFFPRIGEALQSSEAILIVGPGNEKTLLLKYLEERRQAVKGGELRAEACDHPTDREIIALGRRHFHLGEPAR